MGEEAVDAFDLTVDVERGDIHALHDDLAPELDLSQIAVAAVQTVGYPFAHRGEFGRTSVEPELAGSHPLLHRTSAAGLCDSFLLAVEG